MPNERDRTAAERREQSRRLVAKIGEFDPFEDADPAEIEERLRNMHYGATHPRVSELRRQEDDADLN